MLHLGYMESSCSFHNKSMAANTAATTAKSVASAGKQRTSLHSLSKRDLAYFSSERFAKTLKLFEDRELAKAYGHLIAGRKQCENIYRSHELVDAIIYVDIFNAHYDGFNFTYEEVRDLFKGYRSQALREMKSAKGFNALVYRELAKALDRKEEIRSFLKAMNKPIVRNELQF